MAQTIVTLGSVNLSSAYSYITGAGKFAIDYTIYAREYEKAFADSAGTDGAGVKRFGFRQQKLLFKAEYVAASDSACITAVTDDLNTLANTAFTTVVGVTSFYRCELIANESFMGKVYQTGLPSGLYRAPVSISVICKGLA